MATVKDVLKLLDNGNVSGALDIASNIKNKKKAGELLNDYAAMLARRTDAFEDIEALLKKAGELDPKNAFVHYNLGCLYTEPEMLSRKRDYAYRAVEEYRKAIELDDNLSKARFNLALLLAYLGNPEDAWEEYDRLLESDPENSEKYDILEGVIKSRSL